ncbi:MAG: T9SS type A sorting domain-containing protein [Sphingobacteriales bacterium]
MGAQPTLTITAFPADNGGTKTVRIRKIRIVETPPLASFTITSPISVICGKANPVNLAVTNVYSTSGVTGYTWNLGAGNTWRYLNAPAPATITTSTNTLQLFPTCGITPTSLTATVTVGTNSYTTNTATVTSVNETLSIIGSNPLCGGSSIYSIANLPTCGAVVSNWNATPGGIVQITDNGNNTATVTKLANGQVTLTATVTLTNACNTSTPNLSFPLSSGAFPLTGYYFVNSNYNQPTQNTLGPNNAAIFLPANQFFGVTAYISNTNIPSPSWARATSSYPFTWSSSGIQLNFSGYSGTVAYSQRNGTFDFTANTGCGLTTTTFTWPVIPTSSSFSVIVSPNPATDNLAVSIEGEPTITKVSGKTANVTLTLYNLTSTEIVKRWSFKNNQPKFNLNIIGIKKGLYILKVNKDKLEQTKQISIE